MISDYFIFAFRNLSKRKLRSSLTALGIIIAVATLFVLVSLSIGLKEAVKEQFALLGADKFFIQPKGQFGSPGSDAPVLLTKKDIDVIEKVGGVKSVTYASFANVKVEFNKKTRHVLLTGIPLDTGDVFLETGIYKLQEGRFLKENDKGSAMLGSQYGSEELFGKKVHTRDSIIINGNSIIVKSILKPIGNPVDDRNIVIPLEDFKKITNISERIDQIIVQINQDENINEVASRVEKKLLKSRDLTEKKQDFTILTPEEILASFGAVLNILTAFLTGIAALSLLVGGIVIATTMYTSVLERTKEIGVMKAIGAKNKNILLLFLIESGSLGLLGGIIGIIAGYGISNIISTIATQQLGNELLKASSPIELIIGSLAFAFLTGMISGVWPAIRASKLKTVDALRYE